MSVTLAVGRRHAVQDYHQGFWNGFCFGHSNSHNAAGHLSDLAHREPKMLHHCQLSLRHSWFNNDCTTGFGHRHTRRSSRHKKRRPGSEIICHQAFEAHTLEVLKFEPRVVLLPFSELAEFCSKYLNLSTCGAEPKTVSDNSKSDFSSGISAVSARRAQQRLRIYVPLSISAFKEPTTCQMQCTKSLLNKTLFLQAS